MAEANQSIGLVDTDILIDAARGVQDAKAFLNAQRACGGICVSVVSAMELMAGCRDSAALTQTRRFLAQVSEVPLTPAGAWIAR